MAGACLTLVDCTFEAHARAILAILNDAIEHSTALYEYRARPLESMIEWFATKRAGGHPVIGAIDAGGTLAGFASYGPFRAYPAFKYTVEHSVYVHRDCRRRGVGRALLEAIVAAASERAMHVVVGAIDAGNAASIALHERLGFAHAGTVRQAGWKFGRWLDLALYQKILATPDAPQDG